MVKTAIKIIRGGCGINFTENGRVRHALKTPEDGPFMCEIEQAKRLVSLGVAEYVITTDDTEPVVQQDNGGVINDPDGDPDNTLPDPGDAGDNGEPKGDEKIVGHLDAAQLEGMDYNDLKKLAAELGVKPAGKKKEDFIAALAAVEVETDTDGVVDDPADDLDGDPDNELPDLGAADPE